MTQSLLQTAPARRAPEYPGKFHRKQKAIDWIRENYPDAANTLPLDKMSLQELNNTKSKLWNEEVNTEKGALMRGAPAPSAQSATDVLEASRVTEGEYKSLDDIKLTAEFEGKKITHSARHWVDAIDSRIKAIDKLRGCL